MKVTGWTGKVEKGTENAFLPPRVYKLTLFQFTKMFSLNSVFKNESTFRS